MARSNEVGRYVLPIMPSIEGIGPEIDSKLGRAFAGVSKAASQALSTGVRDGVADAERAVKASTQKIAALRDKEADAAGKLRVAEERLQEVQKKGATGATLARAEEAREKALRGQATATKNLEAETKSLETAQRRLANAQEDATRAQRKLADAQEEAARGPRDQSSGGWLDKMKSKAADAAEAMRSIGEGAISGGTEAAEGFVEGFSGPIAAIGTKGGPIGTALAAAAALTVGAGALIAKNVIAGMEQEAASDRIQAQLGLPDDVAAQLGKSAGAVYTANFGESFGDVQQSMADVASTIGAGNPALEDITQKALTLRDVFGTEVSESAAFAQNLIVNELAPDAVNAFDLIAAAAQRTPAALRDEIPELLSEYNQFFSGLGFSGEQAFGLMVASADKGKIYMDKVGDTLKEVSLLATEIGNNDVWGALHDTLGLDPQTVANNLLAGGPQAQTQFQELITKLSEVPDRAQQAEAAIALFGTPMEDLGKDKIPVFLEALRQGTSAMDGFEGSAQRMVDTAGDNPLAEWESSMREIEKAGADVQVALGEAFGPLVSDFANWVQAHKPELIEFFAILGVSAISFGEAVGTAGVMALRALEGISSGMGNTLGVVLKGLGAAADLVGADGLAADLRMASEAAFGFGDGLGPMADGLQNMVDGLGKAREGLGDNAHEMMRAEEAARDLGDGIELLPDEKTIVLKDNTPEAIAAIDKTKYAIEHLPNGEVKVIPLTDEARREFEALVNSMRTEPPVPVEVEPKLDPAKLDAMRRQIDAIVGGPPDLAPAPAPAPNSGLPGLLIPPPPKRAGGGLAGRTRQGVLYGPGTPTSDSILGVDQWGWPTAFVSTGEGIVNYEAMQIPGVADLVAGLNGYSTGTDLHGVGSGIGQVAAEAQRYGLQLTSGRDGREGETKSFHSSGRAGDFSNGVRTDAMLAFATFMAQTYGTQLAELIYDDPRFNMEIKDGRIVDRSFYAAAGDHTNHVHIAVREDLQPTLGSYSLGGNYAMSAGTPGVDPETGESGYYAPDARAVQQAQRKVAEADAKVREEEAAYAELKADAKESERIRAQNQLDKSRADAAEARADLAEAERGKFTKSKTGSGSASNGGGGLDPIGEIFGGFLKETFGLDGSLFPDISNLMPVKMFGAAMSAFKGPLQGLIDGQLGIQQPGWRPGMPVPGVAGDGAPAASGLPFGMIPSPFDFAGQAAPGMAPPGTPASGFGAGPPPGPVDNSRHINQTFNGMDESTVTNNLRREALNVDRLLTYVPKGA